MCCSSSVDYSGMNRAAEANADVAKQALDWYKRAYQDQAPLREQAARTAQQVSDAQLKAMDTQTRIANDADQYNKTVFRPLEKNLVDEANAYSTEDKQNQLAGQAQGDVKQGFSQARLETARAAGRNGINLSDPKYAAILARGGNDEALATAAAGTKARSDAITLGHAMKMDAASLGRNLPAQNATATNTSINAGNSAVGNANVPVQLAQSGTNQVGQGFQTAISGNNSAGNIYGQVAGLQAKENSDLLGGLAGAGMAAGSMGWKPFSDKRMKHGRKAVKGDVALKMARKMPVESWKYNKGSPADDGGKTHIGPMAQDAHKAGGEHLAPGGDHVDLISMNGVTLAAVKALDKKVSRLEKKAKA